jgi:hypothetical protein
MNDLSRHAETKMKVEYFRGFKVADPFPLSNG